MSRLWRPIRRTDEAVSWDEVWADAYAELGELKEVLRERAQRVAEREAELEAWASELERMEERLENRRERLRRSRKRVAALRLALAERSHRREAAGAEDALAEERHRLAQWEQALDARARELEEREAALASQNGNVAPTPVP